MSPLRIPVHRTLHRPRYRHCTDPLSPFAPSFAPGFVPFVYSESLVCSSTRAAERLRRVCVIACLHASICVRFTSARQCTRNVLCCVRFDVRLVRTRPVVHRSGPRRSLVLVPSACSWDPNNGPTGAPRGVLWVCPLLGS